ncbi:hypothetical protein Seera_038 [Serratia phage Seera]|uniref:Uncharacterized protein n=1 Tax=Serratia phage Seera TaxID=2968245 RepID=A0AAX3BPZ4_9CAUD|nr:hypothetical protein Seera_038 [Serratia phage Seera]
MGMFSRAHSGNVAVFREAVHKWDMLGCRAEVIHWRDEANYRNIVKARISHLVQGVPEILIEKDFTDYPGIMHEDVLMVTVGTWFNKQRIEYEKWK